MKIFSKFRDYYDCTLGSFLESDVVIHRETKNNFIRTGEVEELGNFDGKWNYIFDGYYGKTYGHKNLYMIGFCGKWYFFTGDRYRDVKGVKPNTIEYHTFDEIVKNNREMSLSKYLSKWDKPDRNINYKNPNEVKFWNFDLFEKFGPVLFLDNYYCASKFPYRPPHKQSTFNFVSWPCLGEYRFEKVMDPYTTMWELEHWFDSHAKPDDAIVPVGDDITRLQAYGFDKKTSFRKAKEEKH